MADVLPVLIRTGAAALGSAVAGIGYASIVERNAFILREITMPVLTPGSTPLRVLHISDIHMLPNQRRKQAWLRELASWEPDLVVNTGDNLAHPKAVPAVVQTLGDLLSRPGVFVFGSNDYFGPRLKNPWNYLTNPTHRVRGEPLPWQDLRAAFTERGWLDLTHTRREFEVAGLHVAAAGVDDPHIDRDRYDTIAGPASPVANLRLGLTHSPEPRVLDRFAADGYQLVMAGHTHGGQLCLPFYGALVTNCGLDRSRAKGPSRWGANMQLHVSAGIGTSPFAPLRFCCRPEATLLTLIATPMGDRDSASDLSIWAVLAPGRRQGVPQQVGVGAAMGVGLDQPDRVVRPAAWQAARRDLGQIAQCTEAVGCERLRSLVESRSPIGVAINVSRVASGRQQNRTGANGEVPIPAETCNCMFAPQRDGPFARERSRPQLVTRAP